MARRRRPRTKRLSGVPPKRKMKKQTAILREYRREVLGRFTSRRKKIPVRYLRKTPDGMKKVKLTKHIYSINCGYLAEFGYGDHQMQGQIGGWKNDPRPIILTFSDDGRMYVEGINTNYLPDVYMKRLLLLMRRFPGLGSVDLYDIFKRTAHQAIKSGYRKYIRRSMRDIYIYVYEDEFLREYDRQAKMNQKKDQKDNKDAVTVAHVLNKQTQE